MGDNFFQSVQKYLALSHRVETLEARLDSFDKSTAAKMEKLEAQIVNTRETLQAHIAELRERLARLETARNADKAEMQAEVARFKTEVERAQLQLARLLPGSPGTNAPGQE